VALINPIAAPALDGPQALLTRLAIFYYWAADRLPERAARSLLGNPVIVRVMSIVMAKTKDPALRAWIHAQHDRYFSSFSDTRTLLEAFKASVAHTVPEHWPALFEPGKRNVGCTVWETDRIPAHWRTLLDRADRILVAEPCSRDQGVPDVEFKRVLIACDAGDPALGPGGVRVRPSPLGHQSDAALVGRLQGETQACDATAEDDEIEFFHGSTGRGILSIRRALPRNTAAARRPARFRFFKGWRVSASTAST